MESHLKPFRDVLSGVFFVTIGLQLDGAQILSAPLAVFAWLAVPVTDAAAAVTVVAADAMHADAWATALTVMGAHEGHAFALRHGLAARFLHRTADGLRESLTPAFEQHLAA